METVEPTQRLGFAAFELKGVTVRIDGRPVVDDVHLMLEGGRIHGLIGPNGSGKSTLIKLLARQLPLHSGEVLFRGRPVASLTARAFAREVAYLPQFTPSADGLLVRELVALGRFPWHGALGRFGSRDRAKVDEAIERAGLLHMAARRVDTLSGGERQRAWLAMLLAQDASCLLLDEPTSALDLAHQMDVLALVRELSLERAITVVVILHDINLAARHCDSIVALGAGRVVFQGSVAQVMTAEVLERIYAVPMGITHPRDLGQPIGYPL
ncbi:ABC transporter ATP-binding protein [Ancylobacter amanitiformis]|uniref:ABC transporter ATP-binding protein n=1 Tax=Ancylobacter amanitiformis TaxID=217069 RepID=UPI00351FBCF6